jgi:hypothetical protein
MFTRRKLPGKQLAGRKPSGLTSTNVGTAWRAKFFDDAHGSAIECAACLDASVAKGFASLDRIQAGKEMWPFGI